MGAITTAIIATAAVAGTVASVSQARQQEKSAKSAAEEAARRNEAAMAEVKQADAKAGQQAQAATIEKRRRVAAGSRTVYTDPLGISGQATVARKTLLGQ